MDLDVLVINGKPLTVDQDLVDAVALRDDFGARLGLERGPLPGGQLKLGAGLDCCGGHESWVV